jgi:hypothetical protein
VGVGGPCSVRLSYSGWAARAGLEPARASRPLPGSSRVPYQLGHLAMEPPVRIERTSAMYETAALALSYEGAEPAPDSNGPRPYQGRAPQVSYAGGWVEPAAPCLIRLGWSAGLEPAHPGPRPGALPAELRPPRSAEEDSNLRHRAYQAPCSDPELPAAGPHGWTRTSDTRPRKPALCPAELRADGPHGTTRTCTRPSFVGWRSVR